MQDREIVRPAAGTLSRRRTPGACLEVLVGANPGCFNRVTHPPSKPRGQTPIENSAYRSHDKIIQSKEFGAGALRLAGVDLAGIRTCNLIRQDLSIGGIA